MWSNLWIASLFHLALYANTTFISIKSLSNPSKTSRRQVQDRPIDVMPSYVSQVVARFEPLTLTFEKISRRKLQFRLELKDKAADIWFLRHDLVSIDLIKMEGFCTADCLKCQLDEIETAYDELATFAVETIGADLHTIREYYSGIILDCEYLHNSENVKIRQMSKRLIPIVKSRYQLANLLYIMYKRSQVKNPAIQC